MSREIYWHIDNYRGWAIEYPIIRENGAIFTPLFDWHRLLKTPPGPSLGD
jgi:hypothetical protein